MPSSTSSYSAVHVLSCSGGAVHTNLWTPALLPSAPASHPVAPHCGRPGPDSRPVFRARASHATELTERVSWTISGSSTFEKTLYISPKASKRQKANLRISQRRARHGQASKPQRKPCSSWSISPRTAERFRSVRALAWVLTTINSVN